ncbi:site-specific integrase [Lepagella muris]|uniref:Site-specific integrase n=1 Tax=Lepagella muris TaxID=3032870 RepID=A0AC61RFR3_9BACT|nr:site-specific integrase [Lepagella muris]ROT09338.1 site-specific integrase [Muribaculaceae bacterium Isolate-037 (Harlan)]TGY78307.1 site-specific integrase [Lepagella muris]THG47006.1 site-specific integrase [Bacteroidales bacterium]TKC57826.1 site-specific integrase [Bacteroidales bacterium]
MSKSTLKIRFFLRRNHVYADGTCCIMTRITINGENTNFSSKLNVNPKLWDTKQGKVSGKSKVATELNGLMSDMESSIRQMYFDMSRYETVTAEKLRNAFMGIVPENQTLIGLFTEHIEECRALIGISKTPATVQKYDRALRRVKEFIKFKYHLTDMPLRDVNHKFIVDLETYLRTVSGCNENTTAKFIQTFKAIIIKAKNNGWIIADPFANYRIRIKRVDRGYLTEKEIATIAEKEFPTKRLEQVRDIFIFSCYTGLAYIDIKELKKEHIQTSFDGNQWIMTHRHKTGTPVNVPLLAIPQELIKKYEGQAKDSLLFPVLSNQKMNAYLKEIAVVCGIEKNITFHLARHTFATTVTLSHGVPIESVSKMLGHTNIQTMQIYARITNQKISKDMAALAEKMGGSLGVSASISK